MWHVHLNSFCWTCNLYKMMRPITQEHVTALCYECQQDGCCVSTPAQEINDTCV